MCDYLLNPAPDQPSQALHHRLLVVAFVCERALRALAQLTGKWRRLHFGKSGLKMWQHQEVGSFSPCGGGKSSEVKRGKCVLLS